VGLPVAELSFTLDDAIVQAVSRLVDDAGAPREPSHSDLAQVLRRAGLQQADPHNDPAVRVGKQKRVRQALSWALDNDEAAGLRALVGLLNMIRGCGGFRPDSSHFVGAEAIETCIAAFAGSSVEFTADGALRPRSLEGLSGRDLSEALGSYVERAQRGHEDSVLVAGTDKDLLEAVAAHVLVQRYGVEPVGNFPSLLGQAFVAVGLACRRPNPEPGGTAGARAALELALYELGCSINRFRNKAGAGHGRPFLPDLGQAEVRALTEGAGLVAGRLLDALEGR
jgi:hypothetical protein